MTEEIEELGQAIDRVSNLDGALQLPMPAQFHVDQLKTLIPECVADLRAAFVKVTGQNPWGDES